MYARKYQQVVSENMYWFQMVRKDKLSTPGGKNRKGNGQPSENRFSNLEGVSASLFANHHSHKQPKTITTQPSFFARNPTQLSLADAIDVALKSKQSKRGLR